MQEIILQCQGIIKQYTGTRALDNVNLELKRGEIYGFIGANPPRYQQKTLYTL